MSKPWKTKAVLTKTTRTKTAAGGYSSSYDHVEVPLEFDIDWAGLAKQLGQKAFDNKSGRSKFLNGLIVVRAIKPKEAKA